MVRTMADVHRDEGIELGRKEALIKQLKTKFTEVPAKVIQKIRRSNDARLFDVWLERILTASTLDDMEILPRPCVNRWIQELRKMARSVADMNRNKGRVEGRKEVLIKQLKAKFPEVPAKVIQKIRRSNDARLLDVWLERILTATTLDDMEILPWP